MDHGFAPDPFLDSLVKSGDAVVNQPRNSNQQLETLDTIHMPTSNPTSSSLPALKRSATAPLMKRAREIDTLQPKSQEFSSLLLAGNYPSVQMGYGETKKAKHTGENYLQVNPDVNSASSHNEQNCYLNPMSQGVSHQNTGVQDYSSCISSNSLLHPADVNQIPISLVALPESRVSELEARSVNPQCIEPTLAGVHELDYNEEINRYTQPSMNPPSVASAFLSSSGVSCSPFSVSTLSEDDSPNVPNSTLVMPTHFDCQPATQGTNLGNCPVPRDINQLQGLANANDRILGSSPFVSQSIEPLPTSVKDTNAFIPRSNTASQITCASTRYAFCEVMNPKREYDKNQKKLLGPRRSEQRIQGGKVKMKISTKIPLGDQPPIEVFVRREPSAARKQFNEHPDQFTMERTRIPNVQTWNIAVSELPAPNYSYTYKCEFDLDSVYLTAEGKEVYKLVKSKGSFNNRFQLSLILRYSDGYEESVMPYEFVLKSGRTPTQTDPHKDTASADVAADGSRAHLVCCRYLDAETARITNIHCENIQTKNHDIAYFMRVRGHDDDVPSDMEKGDVVAFLEDEDGDTYIDFLTTENACKARLAGVISRTAFFRGRTAICDPDHLDCDLVCIIGEVEVKVVGKAQAGDLIYTSNCEQYRGSAVARNPLEAENQDSLFENGDPTATLLGMAMESNSDIDIKLVRCLVSIVLGISDLHQRRTLEELRNCHDKIVKIQRYLKGIWKKSLIFLLFFLITGIMCYVFLAPNSPYLIMKCEKGCTKNKKGSCQYLKFEYFQEGAQESDEIVGIRFEWKKLKRKLDLNFNRCPNQTSEGFLYYLNKNRCVTGSIRAISSWLDPSPRIPKVNVLGVSLNCSQVFYHSAAKGHWVEYNDKQIKVHKCEH